MAAAVSRKRKQVTDDLDLSSKRITKSRRTINTASKAEKATLKATKLAEPAVITALTDIPSNVASQKPKASKRQREPEEAQTPQNKKFKDANPPTPLETPTRGASRLFDRLNLAPIPPSDTISKETLAYSSPPQTPQSKSGANLPPAVDEAIQLFAAFHSAWSLFIAHNGSGTPIHMVEMLSRATATWKKRRVTLEDVRRVLGILGDSSPFLVMDNGDDLCLEIIDDGALPTIMQTKKLIHEFEHRIRREWKQWCAAGQQGDAKGEAFLQSLPLAKLRVSEVARDTSRLSKGAQRLELLKENAASAVAEASSKKIKTVEEASKTKAALESRGAGLIDRIMAKQQLASNRPSGPTREELERRAALDRIEDVVPVFSLLAGGRPRASFSTQMLVQHLRNSTRNPIAREEAELAIELMAKEICPRFVNIIKSGSVNCVVITKMGRPSSQELKERLQLAQRQS